MEHDEKLEWEADRSGVIHLRKHQSETKFLEGYGTTNFGRSAYELESEAPLIPTPSLLTTSLAAVAGLVVWNFRRQILSPLVTLTTYGLLIRESRR